MREAQVTIVKTLKCFVIGANIFLILLGNMWKHVKKQHPNEYKMASQHSRQHSSSGQSFSESGLRQRIAIWVIKKDQPFTVVDDDEFREIVTYLRPNTFIPSSTTLKRDIIDLFKQQKQKVTNLLQQCSGRISFAVDAWTSANFIPFLGMTVHWIDANWKARCLLISLEPLSGPHSGDNLAKVFVNVCNEFGILSKIQAITTDNAANNITFLRNLEISCQEQSVSFQLKHRHVRCLAHIMNLAVQDFLEALKSQALDDEDG